jgi:predicted dehydrogenase
MRTSRRTILQAAAAALPLRLNAADRIRIGVIGTGNRSNLLMDQLPEEAEIVAVADCFLTRARQSAAKRQAKWDVYQDYRRILDRKDIDGVIVGTGDFQRVIPCIHACQAGKDVYAEKPLTLYVAEGRALVNAARRYNRIFQVGSQQRSMAMNRVACDFVRTGGLGRLHFVQGVNYPGPTLSTPLPEEPMPADLDWNVWQGQSAARPYNAKFHTGWMRWRDYSGGEMTNWGAHGLDQIQMALGMDATGPVEWWPMPDGPKGAIAFRYASGVTVRLEMPAGDLNAGAIFVGEKGRIEIVRNGFRCDPAKLIKDLPPEEEVAKWNRAQWQAKYHMQEWTACMRSRKLPSADVETGHRSITVCHLANITRELNRRLQWDPERERFVGDESANALLTRPRRAGFELP